VTVVGIKNNDLPQSIHEHENQTDEHQHSKIAANAEIEPQILSESPKLKGKKGHSGQGSEDEDPNFYSLQISAEKALLQDHISPSKQELEFGTAEFGTNEDGVIMDKTDIEKSEIDKEKSDQD
jgi:hypothetical protein